MGPQQPHYGYYGAPQRFRPNFKLVALIIGVLILVFGAIGIFASFKGKDTIGTQAQHLGAQLTNLTALTTDGSAHLVNGDLKKINAETTLITDGVTANLAGTIPTKLDKSIVASESDTTTRTSLASALLAGTYDSVYKSALQQKLESISAVMSEMYTKTTIKTTKTTLSGDYKNYQALLLTLSKVSL